MPTIVDFPTIVKDAVDVFGDLCAHAPERRPFAESLTGLMVAEKTTVSGINSAFVVTTDQSCLNRWLPEVAWDVKALNDRRLEWLPGDPKPRYRRRGVMAIDNTLGDHAGKLITDVGWCWDQANERYVMAHDSLIAHYVCPSGAHSPIAWRRFKQREACQKGACTDHTDLGIALLTEAIARGIPGDFTCDSYCPSAKVLNHIASTTRASVGDLKLNRKLVYEGREPTLQAVARQMPWRATKPVRVGNRRAWYFRKQMRIPDVTHPVRMVVFWKERAEAEASTALVSHRLLWEVMRMVLVSRHRWTGTETLHRDGKQALGLGECPVRTGEGQTRHVYLVSAAYSLLRRSLHQSRPQEWARTLLTTIGEACRAVKGELLGQLVDWSVDKLTDDHWSVPQIKAVLAQTYPHSVWADCKSSVAECHGGGPVWHLQSFL